MTDRPILFSAPMVKALFAGRKTQTRRILRSRKGLTIQDLVDHGEEQKTALGTRFICRRDQVEEPRIVDGDRLWCREAFSYDALDSDGNDRLRMPVWYWADGNPEYGDWSRPKPSIHMPRWASRLTLVVESVKVERLNDISEDDALAEGIIFDASRGFMVPGVDHPNKNFPYLSRCRAWEMYAALWDVINGSGAWLENPWVAAYTFTVHHTNIDTMAEAA